MERENDKSVKKVKDQYPHLSFKVSKFKTPHAQCREKPLDLYSIHTAPHAWEDQMPAVQSTGPSSCMLSKIYFLKSREKL